MKKIILFGALLVMAGIAHSQSYPDPEFSKEVYYLKKDSVHQVVRLEKASSKMENKIKMGGMGGSESAYIVEAEKSRIRLRSGNNLSFVFSTGAIAATSANMEADSVMRANGMDPSVRAGMEMNDPSGNIILYKLESGNGKRRLLLQKNPGMMPFGSRKQKAGLRYEISVKKIRDGYWELVIDKPLPKGEYAFMNGMGMMNVDGSVVLFLFGVDE